MAGISCKIAAFLLKFHVDNKIENTTRKKPKNFIISPKSHLIPDFYTRIFTSLKEGGNKFAASFSFGGISLLIRKIMSENI